MSMQWKIYDGDGCPNCGDEIEVYSEYPGNTYGDGEHARCVAQCGYESAISADEDGVWLQDGNIDELTEQ